LDLGFNSIPENLSCPGELCVVQVKAAGKASLFRSKLRLARDR
jgi:hypothetical protein